MLKHTTDAYWRTVRAGNGIIAFALIATVLWLLPALEARGLGLIGWSLAIVLLVLNVGGLVESVRKLRSE